MNYTKSINENQVMKPVPIRNQYVLEALNGFLWFWKNSKFFDNMHLQCHTASLDDGWTSPEYMQKVINEGNKHDGFPEVCKGYAIAPNRHVYNPKHNRAEVSECIEKFIECNNNLAHATMARNNALAVIYPEGGFISWHNNHNAPGYNLIFTYSESDSNFFEYYDSTKGEIVKLYDTAGQWTCKAGYFASFKEPIEKRVYHSATAVKGDRMTISYVFNMSEMANGLHDETIEEIMTEF